MMLKRIMFLSAGALAASTIGSHAGPCSSDIDRMQVRIDTKLNARAAAGPSATEGAGALLHRQPTPRSVAAAETQLGDVTPQLVATVEQAMTRARAADSAGDQATCEKALADVLAAIGP
jgi:hypothetical protein